MISDHNLDQAIRQTSTVDSRGFRSSILQPDPESQKRHLDSTHRTSFINHFVSSASSPQRSSNAHSLVLTPAGGVGGRNIERGKAASGAMGEAFRVSDESQRDTHAQRSWMYSTDPMIVAMHQKAARGATQPPEAAETEADRNNSKPEYFRRQTTSITSIPQDHRGVFADD